MDIEHCFEHCPFIPVIKIPDSESITPLAEVFVEEKVLFAEITFRSLFTIEAISKFREYDQILTGAGTVINKEQAQKAFDAGAQFIVSPGLSRSVVEFCLDHKLPVYPGAVTPTEIMTALEYGLNIIKFFPAQNYGGLATMKSLSGPFPQIKFIPTGGIQENNLGEFLKNDFIKACGGSWVTPGKSLENKDFASIKEAIKDTFQIIKSIS